MTFQESGVSSLLLGPWLYGEHRHPLLREPQYSLVRLTTGWVRNSAAWMVEKVMKDRVLSGTMRAAGTKPVHEFHKCVQQRDDYSCMFYREVGASDLSHRSALRPFRSARAHLRRALPPTSPLPAFRHSPRPACAWIIGRRRSGGHARRHRARLRPPLLAPSSSVSHVHFRQVWDKHRLDGIIAPTLAIPALPHE